LKHLIIGLSCFFIFGCSDLNVSFNHCFSLDGSTQKCSVIAKFKDLSTCENYNLIFQSRINYEELKNSGKTNIQFVSGSSVGSSQTYCIN
jgi:hypothetical protein